MIVDRQEVRSPRSIVWNQLERVLEARSSGKEATEELSLLLALYDTIKDGEYAGDLGAIRRMKRPDKDAIFYGTLEAGIRLLDRNNLWLKPPRAVEKGEEWGEAI